MKLSIIVPVYNVEKYIKECIDSLLKIPLDDMEIIVVNDGTKDKSIELLSCYTDYRIKIVHRVNGGLSAARNTGLDNARGEYILFIDSDDFIINQDAIINMINIAEENKCDVIIGNGYRYLESGEKLPIRRPKQIFNKEIYTGKEYLEKILFYNSFVQVVWVNLYRHDFLKNKKLKFKKGIYHEDLQFTPRMLLKADTIGISKEYFYMYRQREGSIMTKKGQLKNSKDIFEIIDELYKEFESIDNQLIKQKLSELSAESLFSAVYRGMNEEENFLSESNICLINKCVDKSKKIDIKIIGILFKINKKIAYKSIKIKMNMKMSIKKLLKR